MRDIRDKKTHMQRYESVTLLRYTYIFCLGFSSRQNFKKDFSFLCIMTTMENVSIYCKKKKYIVIVYLHAVGPEILCTYVAEKKIM
jgi:hypothetical protein